MRSGACLVVVTVDPEPCSPPTRHISFRSRKPHQVLSAPESGPSPHLHPRVPTPPPTPRGPAPGPAPGPHGSAPCPGPCPRPRRPSPLAAPPPAPAPSPARVHVAPSQRLHGSAPRGYPSATPPRQGVQGLRRTLASSSTACVGVARRVPGPRELRTWPSRPPVPRR